MTSIEIGNLGEALVLQEFLKHGIQCYLPWGDGARADLIAEFNNKLNKIQIKTCEKVIDNAMTWKVGGGSSHKIYQENEIDYFALCCIENSVVCFVPFANQRSAIKIRTDIDCLNKTYNMHFMDEYTLEKIMDN